MSFETVISGSIPRFAHSFKKRVVGCIGSSKVILKRLLGLLGLLDGLKKLGISEENFSNSIKR